MTTPRLLRPKELDSDALDWSGRWRGSAIWDVLTAARDGDVRQLAASIEADPSIVHARFWYVPAIHFAVREGHLSAAQLLVEAGAPLTYRSSLYGGDTLLRMAEDRGHEAVTAYLREELGKLDADGGRDVIHDAVESGDVDRVVKLLEADASAVNRGDDAGRRPLHYAVEAGRRDLVDLLLERGAELDATGSSSDDRLGGVGFRPVVSALWANAYWKQRNDHALARHLLERGSRYSITVAAALNDEAQVEKLLSEDRSHANDAEACGKRPLSAAAERNHEAIVRLLLEAGADPNLPEGENCPRGYALWAAARLGHRAIAELLLEAGADPNADVESSGTPTEAATDSDMRALLYHHGGRVRLAAHFWEGNLDVIAALLDARRELFDDGAAAEGFIYGVAGGHESLVRLLLARGVRVPRVVTACQTYLWDSLELARLLLEHGMDSNLPNWQQIRPLHHLAGRGEIEKAKLFLEFGADLSAVDEEYRSTPLGWAARCGQTDFVRFLLGENVNADAPDTPAWAKPEAWARRRGHEDIVELLNASGA